MVPGSTGAKYAPNRLVKLSITTNNDTNMARASREDAGAYDIPAGVVMDRLMDSDALSRLWQVNELGDEEVGRLSNEESGASAVYIPGRIIICKCNKSEVTLSKQRSYCPLIFTAVLIERRAIASCTSRTSKARTQMHQDAYIQSDSFPRLG
jgi:hypothetical protein